MPKKGDKRKGRRTRASTTPVPQTTRTSAGATATKPNHPSTSTSTNAAQTRNSGRRRTNNSLKGRGPAGANTSTTTTSTRPNTPAAGTTVKKGSTSSNNGKGTPAGNIRKKRPDYSSYTADDQTVYKPGEYAYVDSQQSDQPYHICLIMNFKGTRKDTVTAEVRWFYRVCELPQAVYYQLMEDRKESEDAQVFSLPSIKDRELFTAFNVDTHPAHFFRGKCCVKELSTISDLSTFLPGENNFFYQHGYKPESRRMTKLDEFSFIPYSQQAVLPDYNSEGKPVTSHDNIKLDRYSSPKEALIWKPSNIEDDNLLMYLRAARSVALHAGVCMYGLMRDGYMAASSDETTQQAFDVLHGQEYDKEKALLDLIKKPIAGRLHKKRNWSKEHSLLFAKGMRQFGKNFRKIKNELLPNKEITELIEYYYYWKKTTAGLSSRSTRKQRKQFHIRMSRAMMKPENNNSTPEPEREFIDVSSGDEDDMEEDGEKCFSYHACRHCYSTESSSWHHSGSDKTILCQECRLYFRKYSCMRPLTVKREPPDFMFKDYHLALAEESGRKTRNSNSVRQNRAACLRNGKIFSKSDSDDEGSDTTDFSSTESVDALPTSTNNVTNTTTSSSSRKELPSRRSLLDLMDTKPTDNTDSYNNTDTNNETSGGEGKEVTVKKEEKEYNGGSDEEGGSGPSTVAEEMEHDEEERKSSEDHPSGTHSPESCGEERPLGPLSATTPSASAPLANKEQFIPAEQLTGIPQQFVRVRHDKEGTCARTDLVYEHPPPEERKALSQPQKAIPHHIPQLSFGSSDHASSANTSHAHSVKQVPTITTYEPHLPSGPGHFISFPLPHPLTPTFPIPVGAEHPFPVAMGTQQFIPPSHISREDLMLWHQQQQQIINMKQLEMASLQGPSTGYQPTGASNEQQQMIFQFPTPEELSRLQRHTTDPLPPHNQYHPLVATPSVIMETCHHDDATPRPPPISILPPTHEAIQQQQLLQQQLLQQQHQQLAVVTPELIQEFRHQYIVIMHEAQKNPEILNNPGVQNFIGQYRQIEQSLALQQQQQQQELLIQQELMKQQKYQPTPSQQQPATPANRPGVIMNLQK